MDRLPDRQPDRTARNRQGIGCAFPGNPGRPSAAELRARIEAEARRLAQEFGGLDELSIIDRTFVMQAAGLLIRRPRRREDQVRRVNAVGRLLNRVRRSAREATPSFSEVLR